VVRRANPLDSSSRNFQSDRHIYRGYTQWL